MIPRRIVRTVPEVIDDQAERWWATVDELHPGWELVTWRDPIPEAHFPRTFALWPLCTSGAQRAGLVRLEDIASRGGIYLDSDVELYRSLDPLRGTEGFAGWEDAGTVADAVFGAQPHHAAIQACLTRACELVASQGAAGSRAAWASGPGVFTALLPGRDDVLLLPPGSFYPYHYTERNRRHEDYARAQPWAFAAHHWAGSWLVEG
jgi:mannosyltransferase OCH1-like enzyme